MTDVYAGRQKSVEEALKPIQSGWRVLVGSGAAEPQFLVRGLVRRRLANTGSPQSGSR